MIEVGRPMVANVIYLPDHLEDFVASAKKSLEKVSVWMVFSPWAAPNPVYQTVAQHDSKQFWLSIEASGIPDMFIDECPYDIEKDAAE